MKNNRHIKTWMYEAFVVATILFVVWLLTGHRWIELIGSIAVFFTFKHAQISDRMQELQAVKSRPDVHCYRWSNRYFVAKEFLWILFFALTGAYSAITGAVLFCLYPFWRRYYRKFKPIKRFDGLD